MIFAKVTKGHIGHTESVSWSNSSMGHIGQKVFLSKNI